MAAEKIPLETLDSSMAAAAGYNPTKQILAIQFAKSGTIKHYAGVSPSLALEFYASESKGRFLGTRIFKHFQVERMTGPCANCGAEGWIGDKCEDCGTATYEAAPEKPRGAQADDEGREPEADVVDY